MNEVNDLNSTTPRFLLPEERRIIIRKLLREQGSVRTTELAKQMDVNPATVRRDLRDMSSEKELRLVHGGATIASPVQPVANNSDLNIKRSSNIEAKLQIAKKAINMIHDGDIVALTSGSTVELIVQNLPQDYKSLTVVTLSLSVACLAVKLPYVNLIIPGGMLYRPSQAIVGQDAVNFISSLRVDKGFFGAQAADVNAGFTESNQFEAATNRELFNVCTHQYLVADSSKFGRVALGHICDLDEFDGLIVDDYLPESIRTWALATNVTLI